jgi:hypothetical protein
MVRGLMVRDLMVRGLMVRVFQDPDHSPRTSMSAIAR